MLLIAPSHGTFLELPGACTLYPASGTRTQDSEAQSTVEQSLFPLSVHSDEIYLEVTVNDVLVMKVLHGREQGPHEVTGLLLVVKCLRHDPVEELPTLTTHAQRDTILTSGPVIYA